MLEYFWLKKVQIWGNLTLKKYSLAALITYLIESQILYIIMREKGQFYQRERKTSLELLYQTFQDGGVVEGGGGLEQDMEDFKGRRIQDW